MVASPRQSLYLNFLITISSKESFHVHSSQLTAIPQLIRLLFTSRGQVIVDKAQNVLPDQTLVEGRYLYIYPVHLPPTMGEPGWFQKSSALAQISTVDHENYRVAWLNNAFPHFLMHGERWQSLSVDVDGKTKYESTETFGGILAYIIKFFLQEKLVMGFKAQTEGLKRRAEQI
jgi:hypothetical protein